MQDAARDAHPHGQHSRGLGQRGLPGLGARLIGLGACMRGPGGRQGDKILKLYFQR